MGIQDWLKVHRKTNDNRSDPRTDTRSHDPNNTEVAPELVFSVSFDRLTRHQQFKLAQEIDSFVRGNDGGSEENDAALSTPFAGTISSKETLSHLRRNQRKKRKKVFAVINGILCLLRVRIEETESALAHLEDHVAEVEDHLHDAENAGIYVEDLWVELFKIDQKIHSYKEKISDEQVTVDDELLDEIDGKIMGKLKRLGDLRGLIQQKKNAPKLDLNAA